MIGFVNNKIFAAREFKLNLERKDPSTMKSLLKRIGNDESILSAYAEAVVSNVRMAVLDRQGKIIWVNERFSRLLQYSHDALVGQPITILNCVEPAIFTEILSAISANTKWSGEVRTISNDGSVFWFKTTILPVAMPGQEAETFLVLNTNITPTKTAQEEKDEALINFSQSEARYRALVETQPDLISLCRADGTRIFVNDSYCRFFGKEAHELIGTNIRNFSFKGIPSGIVDEVLRLSSETSEISRIYEVETASGEKRWISFCVKGIFDTNGNLYELLTIGRNVSELKNAELRKGHYIDALERIAHMTSHKVRAPIASMLGLLELMRINAIHSDQWDMAMNNLRKCIVDMDNSTRELGSFIDQRQI
jgi:PAS domain S-box-containing protein